MKHLYENNESYLQHLRKAMSISGLMLVGSGTSFIHGVAPFLVTKTTSNILKKINNKLEAHETN